MMSGVVFIILVAFAFLSSCEGNESFPERQCIDPQCSGPISRVKSLHNYFSDSKEKLSFKAGQEFDIYGKLVGEDDHLWIAEIAGKKGYVKKGSVRELKMLHSGELTLVPSNLPENPVQDERIIVKPEDSVNQAVSSDKVIRPTDTYEVFEGTTIPFHQMTATGTTIDAEKEMETSTHKPTSSFFSQYSESNTMSNMQSEMSPITPTTMTKEAEDVESLSNIDVVSSESKISNVIGSMMKSVSDFVSGENKDTKENHESPFETPPTEGMSSADNTGQEERNVLSKSSEPKESATASSDLVNDNKEATMDTPERELEEEEEDDDEGDDDDGDEDDGGEGEEEEEEDENGDEESGEANEEINSQMESNTVLDEERQRSSAQTVEKTVEVVKSTVSVETHGNSGAVDFEAKKSGVDDSFEANKSESLKEAETAGEIPTSTLASNPPPDTEHLERKDSEIEATKDVNNSPSYSETIPPNYLPNSETSNISSTAEEVGDASLYRMLDKSTARVENFEPKSAADVSAEGGMMMNSADIIDQHEQGPSVTGQNSDQDSAGGISSQNELKKDDDVSNSEQNDLLQNKEQVLKNEEITSEATFRYNAENSFQPISGELDSKVDINQKSSVTSAEMSHSEPTTVSPHYEGIYPENNVGISTPPSVFPNEHATSEESPKQETSASENGVLNPVNVESTVKEVPVSQIDNNQLELKELDEEIKNIPEAVDKSGSESNLSISEESSGIFSMIFSPLYTGYDYVLDAVFGKSDEIEVITESVESVNLVGNSDVPDNILKQWEAQNKPQDVEGNAHHGISSNDHCEANPSDSFCRKSTSKWPSEGERSSEYQDSKSWNDNAREEYQNPFDINNPSYYGALLFSTAVGGMLVCFFLGKYYMEGKKSDALLLAKLNALEKKLMVSSTECLILKDKLRNADDSSEMIESLRSEVDKLQNEKTQLEKELEVAAEAGLEMDRMVSQCLSSQQACESLMESIEQLRLQANQQQSKTSSLENNLVLKTQENETLAQELRVAEQKIVELSSQLKKVEADLIQKEEEHHEKYDELRKLYDNQKKQYEEDLRNKTVEAVMVLTKCNSLEATLNETKDSLAVKENEIAVLQECLEKIKTSNGEEQVAIQFQDMLDFGKLKAELTSVSKERDRLKEELQGEEEARKLLEDHVKVIKEEVEKLRKSHEAAEREKAEAQTRLEVLSSYFKEKESQLQKELGAQVQKYTDASSVVQHMRSLEEEVENYRMDLNHSSPQIVDLMNDEPTLELIDVTAENEGSQNEALKNEILDQERGYKSQLSTIEKKARENWLAARQAERKLEESKQEAGQLRNRLTMLSKTTPQSVSQNGDDSKQNISVMDSNGELSASPLHMGLASNSSVDSLFLDPNSSPPLVSGGVRMPPLIPPPPFPPLPPFPPMSPYHHPISPPLSFVPPPPPEGMYPQSVDGHRPPPLGRMSSPPPPPSPSHSPHLHHANSRPGKYASPFQDRKGERKSASPPTDMYRGMPIDDRGHMDEWGRYRTPPPHPTHLPDYPPFPYPHPRQHWEDDSMPPTSSFRPLPSQAEAVREKKGGKSKDNHPTEMENLEKANRYGGKQ